MHRIALYQSRYWAVVNLHDTSFQKVELWCCAFSVEGDPAPRNWSLSPPPRADREDGEALDRLRWISILRSTSDWRQLFGSKRGSSFVGSLKVERSDTHHNGQWIFTAHSTRRPELSFSIHKNRYNLHVVFAAHLGFESHGKSGSVAMWGHLDFLKHLEASGHGFCADMSACIADLYKCLMDNQASVTNMLHACRIICWRGLLGGLMANPTLTTNCETHINSSWNLFKRTGSRTQGSPSSGFLLAFLHPAF